MASFDSLKDLIRSVIYENEDQAITGEVMQNTLLEMVRSLGTGYKYIGIADATTDPGTPDENVFYFATTAGTYTNFGNLTVAANEIAILKGSGSSWSKDVTSIASTGALQALNAALEQLGQSLNSVASRVSTVEGQISTLSNTVNSQGGQLTQLNQKVDLGSIILTNETQNINGAISASDTSLLSSPIFGAVALTLPDGFKFSRLNYYNINDGSFNSTVYVNNATVNITEVSGCYARVNVLKVSGENIAPADLKFSLVLENFASEDKRLDQKLIKLTGRGSDGTFAGATQVGDVFYNSSSKLLRTRYTDGSFGTIPFIKGAVYTMFGQLWVWNGSDLVPAGEPTGNVVFDNIAKNVGIEYEIESNTGAFTPAPHIIPAGANVEVYVESFSSDAEGTVRLYGFSSRDGSNGSSYFGIMAQGATLTKVTDIIIEGFRLNPASTTASYKIKVKYGSQLVKNSLLVVEGTQQAIVNNIYEKTEYDDSDLSAGWYNLAGTTAPNITSQEPATWNSMRLPVKTGSMVRLWTVGGGNARAWALTDINRTILTRAEVNADYSVSPAILNVVEDGYLYVNCKSANVADFKIEYRQNKILAEAKKVAAPCMFNPKIQLKKDNLRILDIGNSYTNDATHYLSDIIAAAGIAATGYSHYKAIRGAASFKTWVDCFNDEDTQTYTIGRVSGDVISEVEDGTGEIGDGALFRTALAAGWDLILIHQVSTYANDYDAWQGQGAGGYLKELIRIIRASNPNAAIGFVLVHSYTGAYSSNTEGSSLLRWQNIALSAKKLVANYGVDFIIPYGTAVQNLRASSINVDKNDFSNDGTHLADGIGDYVAGACYFQMIYAPRFDKNIIGNTFRKTDLDETQTGVLNIDNTTAPLAQKAAFAAAYDWYTINNPDDM